MKTFTLALFSISALAATSVAQVPLSEKSIKLGKVAPAVVKTPEFNLTSGPIKRTPGRPGQWLELEVEYETKAEEIDELTFKFTALIEKQVLTGEVSYVNIEKGKDHYAVMYVSPKGLDKLLGNHPLTAAAIENVWVEVNRQGQVLGKEGFKPGAVPNVAQKAGLLLNKNQTPFAPLFYDRYEEIKPAAR